MTKERSGGEPEWEPYGAGIMRVMMSRGATGCQADRARRVALELGPGGGQSIPAALAAYLNPYGLESAKPDLQSTFKKPGAGGIRRALLARVHAHQGWGIASVRYFGSKA